jgi:hypothetical protein
MASEMIFLLMKQHQERELRREIEQYRRARAVRSTGFVSRASWWPRIWHMRRFRRPVHFHPKVAASKV